MSTITCKNCGHHFKGNYCPHCGQSAKVESIGFHYFVHDIPHSVLHIDKGFFYTLWRLVVNPGKTLQDYLAGQRVRHFRPFAFVLIMSTAATLLSKGCQYLINLRFTKDFPTQSVTSGDSFFAHYPSLLIFLLIPILSLITWLCFRRRSYNYWEHFLVNTYLAAYLNVFLLLVSVFRVVKYYAGGGLGVNFTVFMFLFMAYYGHAFGRLMKGQGSIGKNIAIMLLMNFLLATVYMTAFSLTGMMTPWWGE